MQLWRGPAGDRAGHDGDDAGQTSASGGAPGLPRGECQGRGCSGQPTCAGAPAGIKLRMRLLQPWLQCGALCCVYGDSLRFADHSMCRTSGSSSCSAPRSCPASGLPQRCGLSPLSQPEESLWSCLLKGGGQNLRLDDTTSHCCPPFLGKQGPGIALRTKPTTEPTPYLLLLHRSASRQSGHHARRTSCAPAANA